MVSPVTSGSEQSPQGVTLVGILNRTSDSFSDGGRYLALSEAQQQLRKLAADGADIVEFGAASSNPDASFVSSQEEIERLAPLIDLARQLGISYGVDSYQPDVQRFAAESGASLINDIRGFPDATLYETLAACPAKLVVMHMMQQGGKADRRAVETEEVLESIYRFFDERLEQLIDAGIARDRLLLDPGMGFFLSSKAAASVRVLRELPRLREQFGCELFVSVSRKSFLRAIAEVDVAQSRIPTVLAELFALEQGATYIRTHEPAVLSSAFRTVRALRGDGAEAL